MDANTITLTWTSKGVVMRTPSGGTGRYADTPTLLKGVETWVLCREAVAEDEPYPRDKFPFAHQRAFEKLVRGIQSAIETE